MTTLPHPAVFDTVPDKTDFLTWVDDKGCHVVLVLEGTNVKATLIGTKEVWYNRDGSGINDFVGYGKTKEEAIVELAEKCSTRVHNPCAKNWGLFLYAGPSLWFPRFV